MIKKQLFGLFLTTLIFVSCKKELEPQDSSATPAAPAVAAAPATPAAPATANMPPATAQPGQPQPVAAPPVKVLPGMNPPHGQPGHRCEIAVGAPLSSAPNKGTATPAKPATITPTQVTTTSTPAPTTPAILNPGTGTTTTAPGMNPPHGQAGHVCSVAVGAPLPKS